MKLRLELHGGAAQRSKGGFSLVEVLCAVLILGVALVGLTQGITTALQSNKDSELQTVAALFAAGLIESVRAEGFLKDGTDEGECGAGLEQYQWKQTISPAEMEGLHEVRVVLSNSKTGKEIYELRTLLFEIPSDARSKAKSRDRRERS